VDIEIYSDVVCPWCYIGAAHLRAALSTFDDDVVVRWRPFQLDPGAVREPVPDRLARKFGGEAAARAAIARATVAGTAAGLDLRYDRAVAADTFDAHRLLWFADRPETVVSGATADTQPLLADALYRAHFTDGLDVADHDVLAAVAVGVGLDETRVRRLLASTEGEDEVRGEMAEAHEMGITAVPTFVFAGRYAVTGAHPAATLRTALDEVVRAEGSGADGSAEAVDHDGSR
jgi:predicted DsbA family dithiol-disulfide isomerase